MLSAMELDIMNATKVRAIGKYTNFLFNILELFSWVYKPAWWKDRASLPKRNHGRNSSEICGKNSIIDKEWATVITKKIINNLRKILPTFIAVFHAFLIITRYW